MRATQAWKQIPLHIFRKWENAKVLPRTRWKAERQWMAETGIEKRQIKTNLRLPVFAFVFAFGKWANCGAGTFLHVFGFFSLVVIVGALSFCLRFFLLRQVDEIRLVEARTGKPAGWCQSYEFSWQVPNSAAGSPPSYLSAGASAGSSASRDVWVSCSGVWGAGSSDKSGNVRSCLRSRINLFVRYLLS